MEALEKLSYGNTDRSYLVTWSGWCSRNRRCLKKPNIKLTTIKRVKAQGRLHLPKHNRKGEMGKVRPGRKNFLIAKCITDVVRLVFEQNPWNNLSGRVPLLFFSYLYLFTLLLSRRRAMLSYSQLETPAFSKCLKKATALWKLMFLESRLSGSTF